ncbi:MAG: hypothetical protein WD094_02055 [Balneolaceae bacterium]
MKITSATYRSIRKLTAVLLLLAFLIPTGLQAKNLVEYCMMEMSSHHSAQTTSDSDHNCESEPADKQDNHHEHQNCDWGSVCACNVFQSLPLDKDWVPTHKNAAVVHPESETLAFYFTSSQRILTDRQPRIGEFSPPLWLLYDTLLI